MTVTFTTNRQLEHGPDNNKTSRTATMHVQSAANRYRYCVEAAAVPVVKMLAIDLLPEFMN